VTFEDPLVTDIIRSKEVVGSMPVGDVLNLEKKILPSISIETTVVQPIHVEVHTTNLAKKQGDDKRNNIYHDMLIVGQWSDAVDDLDYSQDFPSWCGLPSSRMTVYDEVLNPNIAHVMEILPQHVQKGIDLVDIVPLYTDEKERATSINYLKNRSASMEFTEVVSKATKKKRHKGFQVHNTRSKGRLPD